MPIPRFLVALAATIAFSAPAFADSITLTLLNPSQSIPAGQTAEFDATVIASAFNTGAIFLNSDSFTISGPFTLDDSDFFNYFPASLAPGTSFTGALFTLTDTASAGTSVYNGSFTIFGGSDGNATSSLATVTFPSSMTPATPEPSSLLLLATGVSTVFAMGRRRF